MRTAGKFLSMLVLAWCAFGASWAEAQTPAGCNANLFDQAISRDKVAARPGETVNYTVALVNRSVLGAQIGCNVLDVTANFVCPGPTGAPNGPSTNIVTNVDYPANDAVSLSVSLRDAGH